MPRISLKELKKIGLTDGEISVYQALLELGETTKTSLAKRSKIAPSNIYDITNRLAEKGMISKTKKNNITHFAPASPRHIYDFLEKKEQDINKEKDIVKNILPSLMAKYQEKKKSVRVETFFGWNGMKTVFEDLLHECTTRDTNLIFGASKGESTTQADMFFLKYSRAREEKGIKTKIIFNKELKKRKERISFFQKSKKYNIRFLDQSTPAEIMLYKDKTCIIILTKEPLVIRITGKEATDSFKQYFDVLWKTAK
ncbi:TrmB family transcriptional regulator [Nanoarchaeota archaeon]